MTPPNLSVPPATRPPPADIPDFADLAKDPEIAPLLMFDPVVRKVKRPDGWTDELQRELIARIAATGTIQAAVWQMGKHATGAEALYKNPDADSFRGSWDAAIAIGRRRNGLDSQPPYLGPVPGIRRRGPQDADEDHRPQSVRGTDEDDDGMPQDEKLALLENIHRKFLGKVRQEREARLKGEVVAADFYLRQITFLEVAFDMMAEGLGLDGWELLGTFRRGGHGVLEVAETPISKALDAKRRELWKAMSEPERPEHPPERYLEHDRDHSVEPLEYYCGGHEAAREAERARYAAQHAKDAESQAAWEASAQLVRGTSEQEAGHKLPLPPGGAPGSEPSPRRFDPAAGWGEGQ